MFWMEQTNKNKPFYFNYLQWTNHYFLYKLENEKKKTIKSSEEETIHIYRLSNQRALDNRHSLFCYSIKFRKCKNERDFYGMDCFVFILWCIVMISRCLLCACILKTHIVSIVFGIWCELKCICVLKKIFCFWGVSSFYCFRVSNFLLWKPFFMHMACSVWLFSICWLPFFCDFFFPYSICMCISMCFA